MNLEYNKVKGGFKLTPEQEYIYEYFDEKGYFFSKEIITVYFLSLRTKPFVILTGISGTGKTKIAQILADYMCQDDLQAEQDKRIAFISVKPDWVDNKGLLGYYNLLDEKYHATSLIKLLLEAEKNPDKPYFVILDEMNLARVEQYFSDFLSIMESRTPSKPEGECLELHSLKEAATKDGIHIPSKLHIPPNIYFTGTVNVDESTYMFSPKVLDRANVIEFNEVNLENYLKGVDSSEKLILKNTDVRKELLNKDSNPFCSMEDFKIAKQIMGEDVRILQGLLDILRPYNLHFGYRAVNEISRFIINAKEMVDNFNLSDVMDVQILQKVLPKFHGTRAKLEEPLKRLIGFCYHNDTAFNESLLSILDDKENHKNYRFPRSAFKLSRMFNNLKTQGYTSFIE